ncbi:rubrerythrin family protein [bacterium]|nr:rubrerythrin family protein [bacterium]
MKSIKGTETEKNLLKSFAGESQARNRYTFFASAAKKEGYVQIQKVFLETAENEKEHAKVFFKFLEGGDLEIQATYPAGRIGTTEENLEGAANGEHEEWEIIYKEFEDTARREGFPEIAFKFKEIAEVEEEHEKRYRSLVKNIREGTVFRKKDKVKWHCLNCGYVHFGNEAPEMCPACDHPQAHYEVLPENY